jgi:hypothetical protein
MDFYFYTSMDSTYVRKYSTLMCFQPILSSAYVTTFEAIL